MHAGVPGDRHHDAPGEGPVPARRCRRAPHVGAGHAAWVCRCPPSAASSTGSSTTGSPPAGTTPPTAARWSSASRPPAEASSTTSASSTPARCASWSRVLDDEELDLVRRALGALGRAAVRVVPPDDHLHQPPRTAHPHHRQPERTPMNRLTQFAVAKRSVMLLLAGGPVLPRPPGLGQPQAGAAARHRVPRHHRHRAAARRRGGGRRRAGHQADRAGDRQRAAPGELQSTSANSLRLVVAQFSFGTDLKETLSTIEQNLQAATLPEGVDPQVTALNINAPPVIIAADRRDRARTASTRPPRRARRASLPALRASRASLRRPHRRPGPALTITLDP